MASSSFCSRCFKLFCSLVPGDESWFRLCPLMCSQRLLVAGENASNGFLLVMKRYI
jgi:hypothetical protein